MLEPFDLYVHNLEQQAVDPAQTMSVKQRCVELALCTLLRMQRHMLHDSLHGCDSFEQFREQFQGEMTDCLDLDQSIWYLLQASYWAKDCFYATKETGRC